MNEVMPQFTPAQFVAEFDQITAGLNMPTVEVDAPAATPVYQFVNGKMVEVSPATAQPTPGIEATEPLMQFATLSADGKAAGFNERVSNAVAKVSLSVESLSFNALQRANEQRATFLREYRRGLEIIEADEEKRKTKTKAKTLFAFALAA